MSDIPLLTARDHGIVRDRVRLCAGRHLRWLRLVRDRDASDSFKGRRQCAITLLARPWIGPSTSLQRSDGYDSEANQEGEAN